MLHTIRIEDLTSSGEGVGTVKGKKVFVRGMLPGETAQITVTEEKKRYARGQLHDMVVFSPTRVSPVCPLFGQCGGCQIMHLSYTEQLLWKSKRVKDTLCRIGGIETTVAPCIPSPHRLGYRHKLRLHYGRII